MEPTIPPTVRWAAWLAFAYAAVVLAYATYGQVQSDWVNARDYFSGIVRTIGYVIIGYGLLRRLKFAWWLGVGFSAYLLLGGVFALVVLFALRGSADRPALPSLFMPAAFTSLGILIAFVAMLVHPKTRAVFGTQSNSATLPG